MPDTPNNPNDNQSWHDEQKKKNTFHGEIAIPEWLLASPNPYYPRRTSYEPWYDDKTDYNTNAKSYYDYLGRFNGFLYEVIDFVNRIAKRNLKVNSTNSIEFIKNGDWLDNGDAINSWVDVIQLMANVKISMAVTSLLLPYIGNTAVPNGTKINDDGVWSPDYADALRKIGDALEDLNNKLDNLTDLFNQLKNALQKIIDNLFESGAIDSNDMNNFNFKYGRHIASGNINLFGGVADGNSFIRTSDAPQNYDITSGING